MTDHQQARVVLYIPVSLFLLGAIVMALMGQPISAKIMLGLMVIYFLVAFWVCGNGFNVE